MDLNIRYLLAFQPDPALRALLAAQQPRAGQDARKLDPARLHLTLCTIAECETADPGLMARVATALRDGLPESPPIRLGRVHARAQGAEVVTRGRRAEVCAFYEAIAARLRRCGLSPMHRRSGLRPHVTLGYDRCQFEPFDLTAFWRPDELLLIESHVGRRRHVVLLRLALAPPAQTSFAFDEPSLRLAA